MFRSSSKHDIKKSASRRGSLKFGSTFNGMSIRIVLNISSDVFMRIYLTTFCNNDSQVIWYWCFDSKIKLGSISSSSSLELLTNIVSSLSLLAFKTGIALNKSKVSLVLKSYLFMYLSVGMQMSRNRQAYLSMKSTWSLEPTFCKHAPISSTRQDFCKISKVYPSITMVTRSKTSSSVLDVVPLQILWRRTLTLWLIKSKT